MKDQCEEVELSRVETDAAKWQVECEGVMLSIISLLRVAGRNASASAIIEMVRGSPRDGEDLKDLPKESLFSRCVTERREQHSHLLKIDAILQLSKMPEEKRAMLEASIIGTLLGYGMGE